jgi:hypothetical protein
MKRFTVSIPQNLKERLDRLPDVNWPEVAMKGVLNKLYQLEKLESMGEL